MTHFMLSEVEVSHFVGSERFFGSAAVRSK
jgi:hypothetical protein